MCGSLPGSLCISLSLKRAAKNFRGLNHDALLLFGLLRFQLFSFVVVPRVTANGAHIGSGIGDLLIIDIRKPVGIFAKLYCFPFLKSCLYPFTCQPIGPVASVIFSRRILLLVLPLDQPNHDERDHAYVKVCIDVLRLVDIHRSGIQRSFHFLELVFDS